MPPDHDEALEQLRTLQSTRRFQEATYEQAERDAVLRARRLVPPLSWEDIAQALGRRRSSVWEKYQDQV
jgi:hypothetical protein